VTAVPLGPVVDAEWALYHLQRALWDPLEPRQLGSLDRGLQYRVNGEVYRFASERTLERFVREPALWCGMVRDPVTGRRFLPSLESPHTYWIGGPYFFETEASLAAFVEDPFRWQVIRRM
jgi:YHS domain-containing protein